MSRNKKDFMDKIQTPFMIFGLIFSGFSIYIMSLHPAFQDPLFTIVFLFGISIVAIPTICAVIVGDKRSR